MTTKTVTVQLQIAVWSCVPQGARDHGGLSNRMTVSRNGTGTWTWTWRRELKKTTQVCCPGDRNMVFVTAD